MKLVRFGFVALALLVLAIPAQAADINKDGAARLKTLVQNFMTQQQKLSQGNGQTKVNYQGEVLVEEAGDYYAVTLPYAKITQANGRQVDVGMVSINASPGDAPGQWKMRVAIPTPIITTDNTGKEISRLTIGGQRAAGIWDENLKSFVKLDALYKDIQIAGLEGHVKIPETQIVYDFTKDAANKWSGPGSITLKNMEAGGAPHLAGFKSDQIKLNFTIDQYNSDALLTYREKLTSFIDTMGKDALTKGILNPNNTSQMSDILIGLFTNVGNGMKLGYDVSGLSITKPATQKNPAQTVTIPNAALGMDLSGMNSGKLRFMLKGGHNGMTIAPEAADSKGLTPTVSNIDITLENVPLRDIIELSKNTLDASLQQPEMKQIAGISFLLKLPALLSQAGTYMKVNNTHIGNNEIDIKIEGDARADISAVNSATANAKATFRGLDKLIERLKIQEQNPQGRDIQKLRTTIQQLEWVKQRARSKTTADGQTLHILEFVMDPKGQMLLNGQNARQPATIEKPAKAPTP